MGKWADHYAHIVDCAQHLGPAYYLQVIHDEVERLARPGGRVLNVGVGTGCSAGELASRGLYVLGIDNDVDVLAKAYSLTLGSGAIFMWGDACDLTEQVLCDFLFSLNFDVVFSVGLLEHYDDDQVRKMLTDMLAIGRYVVFMVPSEHWPMQDFGDERLMSLRDWTRIDAPLLANGARIESPLRYYDTLAGKQRRNEWIMGVLANGLG